MIPGIELSELITALGYLLPLIIFSETGLMVGFFLPGDSLLFTAGALVGIGLLDLNIFLLATMFFIAAVVGNTTGYMIGKYGGRKLFRRQEARFFKPEYLREAEKFYAENGAKAIILAQFIPILRTFNPVATGISKINYHKFILFNIIGAFIWTIGFSIGGYYLFKSFGRLIDPEKIDLYILPIVALIIIVSFIPAAVHILKDPGKRSAIAHKVKSFRKHLPKLKML
jgi:membrane-associated protein